MLDMLFERFRFWLSVRQGKAPFWVSDACEHVAVDGYNPFTDRVYYRSGRFGSCRLGPYPKMPRSAFLAFGNQPGWVDKQF